MPDVVLFAKELRSSCHKVVLVLESFATLFSSPHNADSRSASHWTRQTLLYHFLSLLKLFARCAVLWQLAIVVVSTDELS